MRSLSLLLTTSLAAALLAGCGAMTTGATLQGGHMSAAGKARPPVQSMGQIYNVITNSGTWYWTLADLNKDGTVTEAEAQTSNWSDELFAAVDANHDASVANEEFTRWYATKSGPASATAVRKHLAGDFAKLDANKDGFLVKSEVGIKDPEAVLGHPIELRLGDTRLVECSGFVAADFTKADETKDGKLVRAEFEDLWAYTIQRKLRVK